MPWETIKPREEPNVPSLNLTDVSTTSGRVTESESRTMPEKWSGHGRVCGFTSFVLAGVSPDTNPGTEVYYIPNRGCGGPSLPFLLWYYKWGPGRGWKGLAHSNCCCPTFSLLLFGAPSLTGLVLDPRLVICISFSLIDFISQSC